MTVPLHVNGNLDVDELLSLRSAINEEPELRGRTVLEERCGSGTLGATFDALTVLATPAAIGALTTAIVAWIRTRRSDIKLKIRSKDGKIVELDAKLIRAATTAELRALITEVTESLTCEE
jgi:hypothetical protein